MDDSTNKRIEENIIKQLDDEQRYRTSSLARKVLEFIKLHFSTNQLEKYVLEHEANDCAMVARFQQTITINLAHNPRVSVDSLTLNTVRMPHPLEAYLEKHPNFDKSQVTSDLDITPIVLFIHGMGGQISQFEPLMGLLSQCSEIIALDLPGFGDSRLHFTKNYKSVSNLSDHDKQEISQSIGKLSWMDFTSESITEILYEFVSQNIPPNKKLLIVGHSMGTHLAVNLTNKLPLGKVEGMILLSPPPFINDLALKGPQRSSTQSTLTHRLPIMVKLFTYFPKLFGSFRIWDRIHGLNSQSVLRQLVPQTNLFNKVRQFRWNLDIDSNIVLRYFYGFQRTTYSSLIEAIKKYNDNTQDKKTYLKTLLMSGSDDHVTSAKIIFDLEKSINQECQSKVSKAIEINNVGHSILLIKPEFVSGTIINFIEENFPERLHLSPAWVLQVKAQISGDKWGLKNELKWKAIQPISYNLTRKLANNKQEIAPLLGMKTLREGDANHSPQILESIFYDSDGKRKTCNKNQLQGNLIAVVDISHDIPPYNPSSFKHVQYYKCATISKVVPDQGAIRKTIQLIDEILENNTTPDPLIVIHCHYGFNRTGFLICCYLVEKLGWSVHEAIEGYRNAREPGIKHQHFIDALYVRYES